jgi:hypothetical protein
MLDAFSDQVHATPLCQREVTGWLPGYPLILRGAANQSSKFVIGVISPAGFRATPLIQRGAANQSCSIFLPGMHAPFQSICWGDGGPAYILR